MCVLLTIECKFSAVRMSLSEMTSSKQWGAKPLKRCNSVNIAQNHVKLQMHDFFSAIKRLRQFQIWVYMHFKVLQGKLTVSLMAKKLWHIHLLVVPSLEM